MASEGRGGGGGGGEGGDPVRGVRRGLPDVRRVRREAGGEGHRRRGAQGTVLRGRRAAGGERARVPREVSAHPRGGGEGEGGEEGAGGEGGEEGGAGAGEGGEGGGRGLHF